MERLSLTIRQYQLLTDWFLSSTEDIDDNDGHISINDRTNSLEWITGHLIIRRYSNIKLLEGEAEPYPEMSKFIDATLLPPRNTVAFDPNTKYLSLSVHRQIWINYSDLFIGMLQNADEHVLNKDVPFTVLTGGHTVIDVLNFLILHETYHIGQISLFRKALGYKPMLLGWRQG